MSGVAIIRTLLANDAYVIETIPAERIFAGVAPLKVTIQAISITQITGFVHKNLAMTEGRTELVTDRVQVTVMASTYRSQKDILKLVRDALPITNKSVWLSNISVECTSILHELEGPDLIDYETSIYMQSIDYKVNYLREKRFM